MLEFELIEDVASSMVSIVYDVLKSAHDNAMSHGMTEAGADEAVRITIEKLYNAMNEVDMNKHNIVVVRNFKEVQPAILKDATDAISKNEALVYSRVALPKDIRTDNKTSILIAGDDFTLIYGIARIINLFTKKFNVSKYLVIDTILDLMEGF